MKKICFITTIPLTLESFILDFAKYIHFNTDWDITFVCNNDSEFEKRLPEYIHFYPIRMKRGISLSGIKSMFEMRLFFKKQKFDLIQYSTPNAAFYASIAGKLSKVPVRLYCQWGMAFVGFSGIKKYIFKKIEKLTCSCSTWIEPDSKSNLHFSHEQKLYPEKVGSVVWNGSACGVNLKKFDINKKPLYREAIRTSLNIPKEAFVFGYVGRITRDKGVNELLQATKNVVSKDDKTYLMLVGPEEVDETINQELYNWAKESSQVIFAGFTKVVEQYSSAMDCFVLPSYRDGFGLSVVESQAMGVPVIVTNIPGPVDGMKDNITGYVVGKKDVAALEKAMEKMKTADLEFLGRNGIKLAKESFDQDIFFKYMLMDRRNLLESV